MTNQGMECAYQRNTLPRTARSVGCWSYHCPLLLGKFGMASGGGGHGRPRVNKPPRVTPKEDDDNPYFASLGLAAEAVGGSPTRQSPLRHGPSRQSPPRKSPSRQSPPRQSPSRQSPPRQSPPRQSPSRQHSPRQPRSGSSGPAKPPTSRARLLKDAAAEEDREAAEEQGREKRAGEKLLQLKSQRAQVESKLVEWEATFLRTHEREPTAADRQRSSQHKAHQARES